MTDNEYLGWRKSSYSDANGGNCVEVARNLPGVVAIRDSRDPAGPGLDTADTAGTRDRRHTRGGTGVGSGHQGQSRCG